MNTTQAQPPLDPRVRQTRAALFEAFTSLVLSRDYEKITVEDIIDRAGVARSTFYNHYRNKDDILSGSMGGILSVLADAACGAPGRDALEWVLDHLWENRQLARVVLSGPPYRAVVRHLTRIIEERLEGTAQARQISPTGIRLQATHVAEGQFGTIRAWLRGEVRCTGADLASHLAGMTTLQAPGEKL